MSFRTPPNFVFLVILDGWGIAKPSAGNAIDRAITPNMTRFWLNYPHTQLLASGEAVGLPRGEPGNTETGHLNLGAGRIVYQDLERINMAIADGSFFQNPTLIAAINHAKKNSSKLHIMGLCGAGGVHSNLKHLFAILEICKQQNFKDVFIHVFTDGRDSPPMSAKTYIAKIIEVIKSKGVGQIASIMGRYWAMDRDLRCDRTEKAYNALTLGVGKVAVSCDEAINASYAEGKTDEFIEPFLITDHGSPVIISDNDSIIFFNFRIDRPRQLSRAFLLKDTHAIGQKLEFDPYLIKYQKKHLAATSQSTYVPFYRQKILKNIFFVTMTEYEKLLVANGAHVAFPPEIVDIPLGRVISESGFKQLRSAESEKERFVTFYFNGQRESPFPGEQKLIVPSPDVSTYDLKPEMSARELTKATIEKIQSETGFKLIVMNYANADMVGHTGSIGATVTACQVVDECVGILANWVLAYDGMLLITADHGNAEEMINPITGQIDTEHNANPVPFILIHKNFVGRPQMLPSGILADVAPTILAALGIPIPSSMTGKNLLANLL